MRQRQGAGVLVMVLAVSACAGGAGPPARPPLGLADQVGPVDRDLVVGAWRCRDLNPYPGQPEQTVTATYDADGTFVSESETAARPPVGAMQVTARGRWKVRGDHLVTSDVVTEARSADGDAATDTLAGIGARFVNALTADDAGASDVLELSPERLVLRPVGVEDAPVVACAR
jgi:hypothetical protein